MSSNKPTNLPGADLLFGGHVDKVQEPVAKAVEKVESVERNVEQKVVGRPKKDRSSDNRETVIESFKIASVGESEPVKFTFYFPPSLLEELEVAKFRLRMERRVKTSKSDIVNAALRYALKDMSFLERLVKGQVE
jgi:hypothetical protein